MGFISNFTQKYFQNVNWYHIDFWGLSGLFVPQRKLRPAAWSWAQINNLFAQYFISFLNFFEFEGSPGPVVLFGGFFDKLVVNMLLEPSFASVGESVF